MVPVEQTRPRRPSMAVHRYSTSLRIREKNLEEATARRKNIDARMYTVSPKNEERFYLRILLLHVPGATNFEELKAYKGITYESFKDAAAARGRRMGSMVSVLMPKQLRQMFAYICCFYYPSEPIKLREDHIEQFTIDYLKTDKIRLL